MRNKSALSGALRLFAVVAIVAASLRALVPIGYMASLDGGRFAIVPCSGVVELAANIGHSGGADHHAHHGGAAPTSGDEKAPGDHHADLANCLFAASCCASLADIQIDVSTNFISLPGVLAQLIAPTVEPFANRFFARGPPSNF